MCRDPDTKDGYVDAGNNACCAPFQLHYRAIVLCDNCNSIDNDLHQQLDFKHPEKNEKE